MITSLANEKIKAFTKLNQKKYRDETGMFIVEGIHLVEEARKNGLIEEVFTLDESIEGTLVSIEVMKKLVDMDSVPKVIAVCRKKNATAYNDMVLILDEIQDPGNMGTLIRSAVGFGFQTVIIGEKSADCYSPKVVRSTQGAIFNVSLIHNKINSEMEILRKKGYTIYGTSLDGKPLKDIHPKKPFAIVLGNEGNGVKRDVLDQTDENIYIEINKIESLNVSIAGSIIMYEMGGNIHE